MSGNVWWGGVYRYSCWRFHAVCRCRCGEGDNILNKKQDVWWCCVYHILTNSAVVEDTLPTPSKIRELKSITFMRLPCVGGWGNGKGSVEWGFVTNRTVGLSYAKKQNRTWTVMINKVR